MTNRAIPVGGFIVLGGMHVVQRGALHAARHDPLTGLPTRQRWTTRAERATRRPQGLILLLVDGDGVKQVNDQHGHGTGDALIVALARRLQAWNGTRGLVGRLGGDEFVAYLRVAGDRSLADQLDELKSLLAAPVQYRHTMLAASASIGAVRIDALPVPTLYQAMRAADEAMYQAKRDRGGTWHLADSRTADSSVGAVRRRAGNGRLAPRLGL